MGAESERFRRPLQRLQWPAAQQLVRVRRLLFALLTGMQTVVSSSLGVSRSSNDRARVKRNSILIGAHRTLTEQTKRILIGTHRHIHDTNEHELTTDGH